MPVQSWRALIVALFAGCLLAGVLAAQGSRETVDPATLENPVPATAESIADGAALFTRRCAACHGPDGAGGPPKEDFTPPASNLIDDVWDHGSTDGEIFWVIKNGLPPDMLMEPWGDRLSDTDIWNVVNLIRDLAKQ